MLLGGTDDAPPPKRRRAARSQVTADMNKKRSAGDGSRAPARDDEKKPDGVEVPERDRDLLPFLRTHWRPDLISLRSTPAPAVHIFARFENAAEDVYLGTPALVLNRARFRDNFANRTGQVVDMEVDVHAAVARAIMRAAEPASASVAISVPEVLAQLEREFAPTELVDRANAQTKSTAESTRWIYRDTRRRLWVRPEKLKEAAEAFGITWSVGQWRATLVVTHHFELPTASGQVFNSRTGRNLRWLVSPPGFARTETGDTGNSSNSTHASNG
jgi:hypothetical protein